jgi:hypothetical protein
LYTELFILRKLVATVQTQFNNARQSEIVDSDEWADRFLALAHKAFRDLPDEYVTSDFGADTVCLLKFLDIFTFGMSGTCRVLSKLLGKLN